MLPSAVQELLPTPRTTDSHGGGSHGMGGPDLRTVIADVVADSDREHRIERRDAAPGQAESGRAHTGDRGRDRTPVDLLPTPAARDIKGPAARRSGSPQLPNVLLPTPTPTATPYGNNQSPSPNAAVRPSLNAVDQLLPTPTAMDAHGARNATAGRKDGSQHHSDTTLTDAFWEQQPAAVAWGRYEGAIRRWETVLGRPAPAPTETGKNGQPRLASEFVEWMMGLPAGHVCDVPSLQRNAQLKALGNGVVPQQAAHALRLLLARAGREVAA